MSRESRGGAILLDAMGTLVHLDAPVPRLRAALRDRAGLEVDERTAATALKAEIAFYRAHLHTAVDAASLAGLRARCAAAMRPFLPEGATDEQLTVALLEAIVFRPFPEVPGVLAALRDAGWRLVAVSNWDVSLDERLEETGLRGLLDGAVNSAQTGAAKPDGAMFTAGLALAGASADAAWHVGDDLDADVGGATAAGIRPVLVDRDGELAPPDGVAVLPSLDGLPGLVGRPPAYA